MENLKKTERVIDPNIISGFIPAQNIMLVDKKEMTQKEEPIVELETHDRNINRIVQTIGDIKVEGASLSESQQMTLQENLSESIYTIFSLQRSSPSVDMDMDLEQEQPSAPSLKTPGSYTP